jgi:hypothetical protein
MTTIKPTRPHKQKQTLVDCKIKMAKEKKAPDQPSKIS